MVNDDDQLNSAAGSAQNDDANNQAAQTQSDLETAVDELMQDFDLDLDQAEKVQKLEDEGYDEEDALNQVLDQ